MKLTFSKAVRVLMGAWVLTMLHGCGESANGLGNDAQLTVSIPSANSSNRAAVASSAVPNYIRTITITVRDNAENVITRGEIPGSGGDLSLTVPPNLALRVTAEALDESRASRFTGTKDVAPIASGATTSVSLSLDALAPLNALVQPSELGTIAVADNTTDVTVITTNAKEDQRISFAITGGDDLDFFIIDASSGQLSFRKALFAAIPQDKNGDNVYEVQVTFTDGFESVTQTLKVSVGRWGAPDLSFGPNGTGIVTTDLTRFGIVSMDTAKAVVVQSSGAIVVAGRTSTGSVLVRYKTNGEIDTTFGVAFGVVGTGIVRLTGQINAINAMALYSDDAIIIAGTGVYDGGRTDTEFLLARFDKNGNLDASFGGNGRGIVTTDFALLLGGEFASNEQAHALVIQADGKIVVVGETGNIPILVGDATNWNFAVARYQSNGTLDPTFGRKLPVLAAANVNPDSYGFMITDSGSRGDYANAVALQGDTSATSGKIVVAGYAKFVAATGDDFVILRYDNHGQLDASFNGSGMVTTDFAGNDQATAVVIQPSDGKIVAAGSTNADGLALARYNNDGTLDLTFGSDRNGKVTNPDSISESAYALALQPDGKLVVGGTFDSCRGDCDTYFGAVRYNTNGSFDTSFGRLFGTSVETHRIAGVENGFGTAYALALQLDGKLVVVGDVYGGTTKDFGVVRFMAFPPVGCLITRECV